MKKSLFLCCLLLTATPEAPAQSEKGTGSVRLEYQYVRTGDYESTVGPIDVGKTDAHALMLSADYAISERIRLFASIPYIQKRHKGALPHNPKVDFVNYTPPDLRFIDDGSYHGGLQDLFFGVQYQAYESASLSISPFVSYGFPAANYPFYAHAAIGRNVWHIPVGVEIDFVPYFSDWAFNTNLAYVFTEKSLGIDSSHWLLSGSASYYFTPRFAPKVFVAYKHVPKGVSFPDDFPPESFDSAAWFYHDRTIRHSYTNAGIGFDLGFKEKFQFSGSVYTMIRPDETNSVDIAITTGLTRFF